MLRSSAALGWRGLVAELHRIGPDHQPEHYVRTHRLMVQTGPPARFEVREGGTWRTFGLGSGDVMFMPDGTPNEPRWHDTMEFLAIGLDPAFVADSFGEALRGSRARLVPAIPHQDGTIGALANLLQAELREATPEGAFFGETVAMAIARHLLVHYGPGLKDPRGTLTGRQLARAIELLDAHLAEDVGLDALARAAGLSVYHFARLFRATTRLSPHQFVIRRRVERARRLLRADHRRSLADIAVASGFFDQAHLTKTFRQMIGVTPAVFRRHERRD